MPWIILTKKLSTVVAPPKLSIHFAVPYLGHSQYEKFMKLYEKETAKYRRVNKMINSDPELKGMSTMMPSVDEIVSRESSELKRTIHWIDLEQDWKRVKNMMSINFMGESIKLFSDEYNILPDERLAEYIDPKEGSHTLIKDDFGIPEEYLSKGIETVEDRILYEQALMDGCNNFEALKVINGALYENLDRSVFPRLGWYKCTAPYMRSFFREGEDEITDNRRSSDYRRTGEME